MADEIYIYSSTAQKCGEHSSSIPENRNKDVSFEVSEVGKNLLFSVVITNTWSKEKRLKVHVSARNNLNPGGTFWEVHDYLQIAPNTSETLEHRSFVRENCQVKLSVDIKDEETGKEIQDLREFDITMPSPSLRNKNNAARRDHEDGLLFYSKYDRRVEKPAHHSAWVPDPRW